MATLMEVGNILTKATYKVYLAMPAVVIPMLFSKMSILF